MSRDLIIKEQARPGIVVLTLNRPEKRNALNIEVLGSLCDAIQSVNKEPSQRVMILRGEGKVFCAGLDLEEASNLEQAHASAKEVSRALETLYLSPVPIIAAVHGAAIAGGAGLMSACDLAIGADGCLFGYPETRRGLVAGLVMGLLLRQMGERAARDLLLTGDLIESTRAAELGLINEAVSNDRLMERAMELAEGICKGAPEATAKTKELLDGLQARRVSDDLKAALAFHMEARESDEAKEGIAAFLEKRSPVWPTKGA